MANRYRTSRMGAFYTSLYFGLCGVLVDADHLISCQVDWRCLMSGETPKFWHHYPSCFIWLGLCLVLALSIGLIHHVAGHTVKSAPQVTLGE